jgi:hypothetical protein
MSSALLDRWAEDGALDDLARLARDLPRVDAEALRRLERLTLEQRALVMEALRNVGGQA